MNSLNRQTMSVTTVFIMAILTSCTANVTVTPDPTMGIAPTLRPQPTLALTSTLKDLIDFQNSVNYFSVDLTCDPACWNQFIPGKTSMDRIFQWEVMLGNVGTPIADDAYKSLKRPGAMGTLEDYHTPNRFIGGTESDLQVMAFADDTQPVPLLRAYYVNFGLPTDFSLWGEVVKRWLPSEVIKRKGTPKTITLGAQLPYNYALLFDYGTWGMEYGSTPQRERENKGAFCLYSQPQYIFIWSYAPNEMSLFSMIKKTYDNPFAKDFYPLMMFAKVQAETYTTSDTVGAFLNDVQRTGCLVPKP